MRAGLCVVEDDPLVTVLHSREPEAQVNDLLKGIRNGKKHPALGAAGLGQDTDGEVPEEGGWDEGPSWPADIGSRLEAVSWEATIASDKGHRGGQWDADELCEVQMALGG